MLEMEGSLGQQAFIKAGMKRAKPVGETEEKNWERLFQAVYYHMCELLKEQIQEHNADGSQRSSSQCLHILPFTEMADLRYWSSKFTTNPMSDTTNLWKPDLILLDYRLRKSSLLEKSWKDILTGVEITQSDLSVDRKIPLFLGVANKGYLMMWEPLWHHFILLFSISKFKLHAHYMDRSSMVISKPLLIVTSPNVYWIMDILWKSHELFKCGTICNHIQDKFNQEYTLKDCWVDEDVKDVEIWLLKAVKGIPNMVQLRKYWDVLYDGQPDSTSHSHSHCLTFKFKKKIHWCILLTPCGLPLTHFNDVPELIGVFVTLSLDQKVHWPPDLAKKLCDGTPFGGGGLPMRA
ncbi:uncharacterized protein EDB91DRAFT_1086471 [Suillus paluster]|uniref:uncharacterized protein n=1 Tax=Suillus paluster TaxID=48578 RepID=UPI001B866769|nr:uncharacterized protein EDB91DRAFT_1086471 [Suillus paluster]KAG1727268.1 hypothetical protein EDB91DRAFT_1086471 [Suillus paluster]